MIDKSSAESIENLNFRRTASASEATNPGHAITAIENQDEFKARAASNRSRSSNKKNQIPRKVLPFLDQINLGEQASGLEQEQCTQANDLHEHESYDDSKRGRSCSPSSVHQPRSLTRKFSISVEVDSILCGPVYSLQEKLPLQALSPSHYRSPGSSPRVARRGYSREPVEKLSSDILLQNKQPFINGNKQTFINGPCAPSPRSPARRRRLSSPNIASPLPEPGRARTPASSFMPGNPTSPRATDCATSEEAVGAQSGVGASGIPSVRSPVAGRMRRRSLEPLPSSERYAAAATSPQSRESPADCKQPPPPPPPPPHASIGLTRSRAGAIFRPGRTRRPRRAARRGWTRTRRRRLSQGATRRRRSDPSRARCECGCRAWSGSCGR